MVEQNQRILSSHPPIVRIKHPGWRIMAKPSIIGVGTFSRPAMPSFGSAFFARPEQDVGRKEGNIPPRSDAVKPWGRLEAEGL